MRSGTNPYMEDFKQAEITGASIDKKWVETIKDPMLFGKFQKEKDVEQEVIYPEYAGEKNL